MTAPSRIDGLPPRIDLDRDAYLRWLTEADADVLAAAVGESLDHLRPWMPWAGVESADPDFQRRRLRNTPFLRERGEEWQYGLFQAGSSLLGSFGLMTRRGPRTLEIGYWLHVNAVGSGLATAAAGALTAVARVTPGVDRVLICCDEANIRSAAIPNRLGYALTRTETRTPEAPGESGRLQVWVIDVQNPAAERRA